MRLSLVLLLSVAYAGRVTDTPVEKVLQLITDLKTGVEDEGKEEAATYDKFACFCKSETASKSSDINSGKDAIDVAVGNVEQKSAEREEKQTNLAEAKAKKEKDTGDLSAMTAKCAQDSANFQTKVTGLDNDLARLAGAKQSLAQAAPSALIALSSTVEQTVQDLTNAGEVPGEYESHTGGIGALLQKLEDTFTKKRSEVQSDSDKSSKACTDGKAALSKEIDTGNTNIGDLGDDVESLTKTIETERGTLVQLKTSMSESELYLKDVTTMCEDRAQEWDQRSAMRADEVKALSSVLGILTDKVQDVEGSRALLLQHARKVSSKNLLEKAPAFIQVHSTNQHHAQKERVVAMLRSKAKQLKSTVLSALAMKVNLATSTSEDPFSKVKGLIQGLIERLVTEATEEASKKGFCDEQMGTATQARNFRLKDSRKKQTEISGNGVDLEDATNEKASEEDALEETNFALGNATEIRSEEKTENLATIANATQGHTAVKEVLSILRKFYGGAAKALVQIKASGVDVPDDAGEAKGAYKGNQGAAGGIIGMIEVIQSDFERTIKTTSEQEKKAAAEFETFKQESLATIKAKETSIEILTRTITTLEAEIESGLDDLKATQNLLDKAIQELQDLNPMCVDSGMTFAERKAKRADEIKALKCANEILGGEDSGEDC